ncbi:MAG: 16S rRNA processing protein RimM [Thiotrichales bacterium]|nr:MAG: 16S rRNA processing protein RimM [Thiotrichales bacterium]
MQPYIGAISVNDYIELGNISGFFGVKGWVKLYSYSRPRVGIGKYKDFYLGDNKTPIRFTQIKESGKNVIGHIEGINSREEASDYLGQSLFIKQQDLPKLENEYYWHELIGLTVINQQDVVLGKIVEMLETGANDVMVIRNDSEELLIPYAVSHYVLSVDLDNQIMRVDWEIDDNDE